MRRGLLHATAIASLVIGSLAAGPAGPADAADLNCFGRPATIIGTDADDVIEGTDGDDVIVALDGNDTIDAGAGDDRICAGPNTAVLPEDYASMKSDVVRGGAGDDRIDGGPGIDLLYGDAGSDRIWGGTNPDPLQWELDAGTHHLEAETLEGGAGRDVLDAGPGDDVLRGGTGRDVLLGGAGEDTLLGQAGGDLVRGGAGADWISEPDLCCRAGMPPFPAGRSGATPDDGAGAGTVVTDVSRLRGKSRSHRLYGGPGDDVVRGDATGDRISGNTGDDLLTGHNGRDRMSGGPGDDWLAPDPRRGRVSGSRGRDVVAYRFDVYKSGRGHQRKAPVRIDLRARVVTGAAERDRLESVEGVETGHTKDVALGTRRADLFVNARGTLVGRGGSDTVDVSSSYGQAEVDLRRGSVSELTGGSPCQAVSMTRVARLRSIENVRWIGGNGCVTVYGSAADNRIEALPNPYAGAADDEDVIRGRGGDDMLVGGPGEDDLDGGSGRNRIDGGDGTDRCARPDIAGGAVRCET